jgi:hypothetical protein
MRHVILVVATVSLVMSGCKKAADSAPTQTNLAGANPVPTAQPLPPPPAPVAAVAENAPQQTIAGQVDPFLTEQLRIFVQQQRRLPSSFAELAAKRLDSIPGPPPGTRWAIDASTMQVKAVKAN